MSRTVTPSLLAEVDRLMHEEGLTARQAANRVGRNESSIRSARNRSRKPDPSGVNVRGDRATVTSEPTEALADIPALMRERNLDPDEWTVENLIVNEWDSATGEKLRQFKLHLKRRSELDRLTPAVHVPALVKPRKTVRVKGEPETILVEGDHQAPYHDRDLDAVVTQMTRDLQPTEHVFNGDLGDYPTISKYADHPAALATPQECVNESYGILRRRRDAAPAARAKKLVGNHDWRIQGEQLIRAERMHGLAPAGEDLPALSVRRLLHLDSLGVELVEHPLGWEHAEVELVAGERGLVVRHGWLTGHTSAEKSMLKRGRSLIVNHGHGRQHVFRWDPSAGCERQAAMCGTMSEARGNRFPHFAVCDDWLQGPLVVTRWPDGEFVIEHVRWDGHTAYWRDRRWTLAAALKVAA